MVALQRAGQCGGWVQLDPSAETVARYRPGLSNWVVTTPLLPGVTLNMTAAPTDRGFGMSVRIGVQGALQPQDELVWVYGGVAGGFSPNTNDPAVTSNNGGSQLMNDRGNLAMLAKGANLI